MLYRRPTIGNAPSQITLEERVFPDRRDDSFDSGAGLRILVWLALGAEYGLSHAGRCVGKHEPAEGHGR